MILTEEIKNVISIFGIVETIVPIKKTIYNTSSVYEVTCTTGKYILKVFNTSNAMGNNLFQRERMVYKLLENKLDCMPILLGEGKNFLLIEYCADDGSLINSEYLSRLIASFHNCMNLQKNDEYFSFDFFGNGSNIVTNFLSELQLEKRKLFSDNAILTLIEDIDWLLNTNSKHLCHGDLVRNNLRINNTYKIIDFECLSNLPLEFDLTVIFSYEIITQTDCFEPKRHIEEYLSKLYFSYDFKFNALYKALSFDSIRRWRYAKRKKIKKVEEFYFERLLKLLGNDNLFLTSFKI